MILQQSILTLRIPMVKIQELMMKDPMAQVQRIRERRKQMLTPGIKKLR